MLVTMKYILNKYKDCDTFSLETDIDINDISKENYELDVKIQNKSAIEQYYQENKNIVTNNQTNHIKSSIKNIDKKYLQIIPEELKEHLISHEIYYLTVFKHVEPKIKYYFKLNTETKNYLLKFRTDFNIKPLINLNLYKDNNQVFYSITHEEENSIYDEKGCNIMPFDDKIDYKDHTEQEIEQFIIEELNYLYTDDNVIDSLFIKQHQNQIIQVINTLINMKKDTSFTFKQFGVTDMLVYKIIWHLCKKIYLVLVCKNYPEDKKIEEYQLPGNDVNDMIIKLI